MINKTNASWLKLINSPLYQYLPDKDKQDIQSIGAFNPKLFEESKPVELPKTQFQTATELAQKKALQANQYGMINNKLYQDLLKYGLVPDLNNKNFWGRLGATASFPLKKIMSALSAFPRAESAMDTELVRQVGVDEAKKYGFLSTQKYQNLKAPTDYGEIFKSGIQAFFNLKGSKYQDWGWAKALKESRPEWAEPLSSTKRVWENEKQWQEIQDLYSKSLITSKEKESRERAVFEKYGYRPSWMTKAVTAIAGSPADIVGFGLDIATDPLTYISGGAVKGYKIADTSFDLLDDAGKVLVPKGSTVVFTKAGKEAMQNAMETLLPRVTTSYAKEIADIGTDIGKNMFINRKVSELALQGMAKNWTTETMSKFIDLGGLKFMGQTVIPGYKLQQKFGKSMEKIAEIPFLKPINKVFNPYYGIPEALRPTKAYADSLMRTIYGQDMADIMRTIGGLGSSERKTLDTIMLAERDIANLTTKLDDVMARIKKASMGKLFEDTTAVTGLNRLATGYKKKISLLDDIIKNLDITPKIAEAKPKISEILENMYKREAGYLDYDKMQKYFPGLKKTELIPKKTSILGAETAFFEKAQTQDLLTMMKKGIEPEDFLTALSRRSKAGAIRIGRAEELEAIKQFGSKTYAEGLSELVDNTGKVVKELQGWYFPKEYKNTFTRVYQTFFGDDAINQIFKVHDRILTVWKRWALATPGYHMRNFYSDMWSGAMEYGTDFFNPRRWQMAYDANVLRKDIKIGNQVFTPDDLAKAGITTGTQYATEGMRGQGFIASKIEKFSPAYWSVKFGNVREGMGRTVAGIIELEKGSTLMDAAFNVKKVFYDYMALTPVEYNIGRRIFPFYSWLRKNIQRQVELLFTRTGRYATTTKALGYLEDVAETRFGKDFIKEYKANRPDYYESLGATITAMTNKEGQPLVLNPNLPFQDWSRIQPRDIATSMSPFLKIPIELLSNRDLFFKTIIDRSREGQGNYRESPKWLSVIASRFPNSILQFMGMEKANEKVYMTDLTSYLIRQIPPFYVMQRALPAEQTPKTPLDWLSIGAGIKFFNFDLEKEKTDKLNEFIREINTELEGRKQKGEPILNLNELETSFRNQYKEKVGQKYNIEQIKNLENLLKLSGSNAQTNQFLQMFKAPYQEEIDKATGKDLIGLKDLLNSTNKNYTSDSNQKNQSIENWNKLLNGGSSYR